MLRSEARLVARIALLALVATLAACVTESDSSGPRLRQGTTMASTLDAGADDAAGPPAASQSPPPSPSASVSPPASAAVDAGSDAASAPPVEVQLSDLTLDVVANGYGPLEKDMEIGDLAPNDGGPITLNGVTYAKGLGAHAASEVNVTLGGAYKTFLTDVGVDDSAGDNGSVVFQVIVDGETVFDSGVMTGTSDTQKVNVSVDGKQQLKLVVTDAGDGIAYDHADWAGARLVK
jgi:hypothetical protein